MLIQLVRDNAETALQSFIELSHRRNSLASGLLCGFSKLEEPPSEEAVVIAIKPIVTEKQPAIYFLKDGDVVIVWHGMPRATFEKLNAAMQNLVPDQPDLCTYYDLQAQGEDLRLLARRKMNAPAPEKKTEAPPVAAQKPEEVTPAKFLVVSKEDIAEFKAIAAKRNLRKQPEILIVEDQHFSRKLFMNMLGQSYRVLEAPNAEEGLQLYLQNAPDILFLDIELGAINGHHLASAVSTFDPQAYIIMLTASNQLDDVTRARNNRAKGFIVKPYSSQKIDDSIKKYFSERQN